MLLVFGRHFESNPAPQARRTLANVYCDQERRTAGYAHQLSHWGVPLKMQPSQDVFLRTRMIFLNEQTRQTQPFKLISAKGLQKETPLVFENLWD